VQVAQETFADLYRRHASSAVRLAFLLVGDRSKAEDVVADAFLRVLPQWEKGHVLDFGPYLRRAVVNGVRGDFRRDARADRALALVPDVEDVPDLGLLVADRSAVAAALRSLPARQRAAIALRYFVDLPEREIAELLDCPVGTVKATLSRGLVKLRAFLEEGIHE
jgi:RNA polymerase sigma-70 factor (sigma-E family)